jgi:hypothetical protein
MVVRPRSLARRQNGVVFHARHRTHGAARHRLASLVSSILFFVTLPAATLASAGLPTEIRSDRFAVTVNGVAVPVAHAVSGYHCADFDLTGAAEIAVTAPTDGYWDQGVEVQPWRHGIRPRREGRTLRFTVSRPMKLSISRPGDRYADAEILYLFANAPETDAPKPGELGVRYYGPGVYREHIHVRSGETVYLAAGAVVFGSLNVWDAEKVKILGRGIVIHDGPQNPNKDDGWQHRPDWHGITMHDARDVVVRGITCIVRSRTWMIQLQGCKDLRFENLKVIGGCRGNANQDGIAWLGCGDTVVRDCFFRCSDDIFSLYGNTGFYNEAVAIPGRDVRNILIEDCVLSTSVSNVVRVGWPRKNFNSGQITLRNCDVTTMGTGGCVVPFALAEMWADPGGKGVHADYLFENIWLEHWYSLAQLRQPATGAEVRNVVFRGIWAPEQPALVPSVITGNVQGVRFESVTIGDRTVASDADLPLERTAPAAAVHYRQGGLPRASFTYGPSAIAPGQEVTFDASASAAADRSAVSAEWLFGDGSAATGLVVRHVFPDTAGTLLDGSGRFRVLLRITDAQGKSAYVSRPVVVATSFRSPDRTVGGQPGLRFRYFEGSWAQLPDFAQVAAVRSGTSQGLDLSVRERTDDYGLVFEGFLHVPVDGGYTFFLSGKDHGRLEIGTTLVVASPAPRAQPCKTIGNAVQSAAGSIGLKAGRHAIRVAMTDTLGPDGFRLHWQGPGVALAELPPEACSH